MSDAHPHGIEPNLSASSADMGLVGHTPSEKRAVYLTLLPCFALTVLLGLASNGVHQDDDLAHFLMARWACWFPEYLLHFWGRPGLTLPLAAVTVFDDPAWSWHAARLLSACVTAIAALAAARLAMRLHVRPAWAVVLACYLQPLNSLLAATTLTENFAACYLVLAVALLAAGRRVGASAVFSMTLVTRHEMILLLPLWWLALLAQRTSPARAATALAISTWALVTHNVLFRIFLGSWPVQAFFQPRGSTEYAATGLLGYVPHALEAVPPVIAGLAILGGIVFVGRGRPLIPALVACYFAGHTAAVAFGFFASGGFGRFMVTVAPLVAILAVAGVREMTEPQPRPRARGLGWLVLAASWAVGLLAFEVERGAGRLAVEDERLIWLIRSVSAIAAVLAVASWYLVRRVRPSRVMPRVAAVLLAMTCVIQWVFLVRPLRVRSEQRQVAVVVDWLIENSMDRQPIFAPNPWVAYYLGFVEFPRAHKGPALLESMPAGTIVVWDPIYSPNDFHRLPLSVLTSSREYEELEHFQGSGRRPIEVVLFRKNSPALTPPAPDTSYPIDLMSQGNPAYGMYYVSTGIRPARP
ncbi:MAG: hypothetical protein ABII12_08685 [Planctomycetota bacterium]